MNVYMYVHILTPKKKSFSEQLYGHVMFWMWVDLFDQFPEVELLVKGSKGVMGDTQG